MLMQLSDLRPHAVTFVLICFSNLFFNISFCLMLLNLSTHWHGPVTRLMRQALKNHYQLTTLFDRLMNSPGTTASFPPSQPQM
jgi:Na+/phosphate symporter